MADNDPNEAVYGFAVYGLNVYSEEPTAPGFIEKPLVNPEVLGQSFVQICRAISEKIYFIPGEIVGEHGLKIYIPPLRGEENEELFEIRYKIYRTPDIVSRFMGLEQSETLIVIDNNVPIKFAPRSYYAMFQIPYTAHPGEFKIKWMFRRAMNLPEEQVEEVFIVLDKFVDTKSSRQR